MHICCLDLEGVLVPEIWHAVADHTGNAQLKLTTRDMGDYRALMDLRLREINAMGLGYREILRIAERIDPFPGAVDFITDLRSRFQVVILSDTFYELTPNLMARLGNPLLLCHHLTVQNDRIADFVLRLEDPKRKAVKAFKALNYRVVAAGDSLNDFGMLEEADYGVLFRAADSIRGMMESLEHTEDYSELSGLFFRYLDSIHG